MRTRCSLILLTWAQTERQRETERDRQLDREAARSRWRIGTVWTVREALLSIRLLCPLLPLPLLRLRPRAQWLALSPLLAVWPRFLRPPLPRRLPRPRFLSRFRLTDKATDRARHRHKPDSRSLPFHLVLLCLPLPYSTSSKCARRRKPPSLAPPI